MLLAFFLCAAAPSKVNPSRGPSQARKDYSAVQSLVRKSLNSEIASENPGEIDLFFLGVALYGDQDVFMRETLYAHNLFEDRYHDLYGSGKKSFGLSLVNNIKTANRYLFATKENIAEILKLLGKKMGEEDILFIYFTSHGSRSHKLSMTLPKQFRNNLDSKEIRTMLDDADIPWRMLIVSACFSGGFIPGLESPKTLVATAADPNHSSFGCTDTRNFTYYGEALFKRQLNEGTGLLDSLYRMPPIIKVMEDEQGYKNSNPQMVIGDDFLEHWQKYQDDLRERLTYRKEERPKRPPKRGW